MCNIRKVNNNDNLSSLLCLFMFSEMNFFYLSTFGGAAQYFSPNYKIFGLVALDRLDRETCAVLWSCTTWWYRPCTAPAANTGTTNRLRSTPETLLSPEACIKNKQALSVFLWYCLF